MKPIYILLISIIAVLTACTEPLDTNYKGKTENLLVVIGEISTDTTTHSVRLTRSVDYNALDQIPERNAIVTISDGTKTYTLTEDSAGIYLTEPDVFGEIGKTYTLNIQTADGMNYSAVSKINPVADVDSVIVKFDEFPFLAEYFYFVYYYGQEPAGIGNYYIWNLYLNDSLYNDTISKSNFQSDDFVDGQYITDFDVYWLTPDEVKDDTTKFTLEIVSIGEGYYNYLIDIMSETEWRGGPFDPTPANVSTNITGDSKALGYFKATAKKKNSFTYIKTGEEDEHINEQEGHGF